MMDRRTGRALTRLKKLCLFSPEAIVTTAGSPHQISIAPMSRRRLDQLVAEMPGYISFLEEVQAAAQRQDLQDES